jgi:hypothetical protein
MYCNLCITLSVCNSFLYFLFSSVIAHLLPLFFLIVNSTDEKPGESFHALSAVSKQCLVYGRHSRHAC